MVTGDIMKNIFAVFLKEYSSVETTFKELDAYIGNSQGKLSVNEGSGKLASAIHNEIQQAIFKVVTFQLTTKAVREQELRAESISQELSGNLNKLLYDHCTFSGDLTKSMMVEHFMTEIYTPLLSTAQVITEITDSPDTKNNLSLSFRKGPQPG